VALKLKLEGVRPGVPDTFLPVARILDEKQYDGLCIEMKIKPNKPTCAQANWLRELDSEGYRVKVCYSRLQARD